MKYAIITLVSIFVAAGCATTQQTSVVKPKPVSTAQHQQILADQAQEEMESDIQKGTPTLVEPPTYVPVKKAPVNQPPATLAPIPVDKATNVMSLKPVTKYPIQNGYPVWFYNNMYDGYLGVVGIASKQPGGSVIKQKQVARMMAQKELAKQIEVLVRSDLTVTNTNVDTAAVKYYKTKVTSLTKEDADQYLSGYSVQDEWIDPSTGDYYMWMVLNK